MVPLWQGKIEVDDGIRIYRIPALKLLPNSRKIYHRINVIPGKFTDIIKKYDIIHFHDAGNLSFPFFSLFTRRKKILHLHWANVDNYYKGFIDNLIINNIADLIICYNQY